MEQQEEKKQNVFEMFREWFPFQLDVGSEYERDESLAELRGHEADEAEVQGLNFSELNSDDLCVAYDCRATTLVYYWKFTQEKRAFSFVHGFSVQKRRTDPHWAFSIFGEGTEQFLVDPLFCVAIPMSSLHERNGTYFASCTLKNNAKYQYCFTKCPLEQQDQVLSSLRLFVVEKKMRFFPAMFGAKGLCMFPEPQRITAIFNAQLKEMSRLLGHPLDPDIDVVLTLNNTAIGADLKQELTDFCVGSKGQIEKRQVQRVNSCTHELTFDFEQMFVGSQLDYFAILMCK